VDYCLYSQLIHIRLGFNISKSERVKRMNAELSRYPYKEEAEETLETMGLKVADLSPER